MGPLRAAVLAGLVAFGGAACGDAAITDDDLDATDGKADGTAISDITRTALAIDLTARTGTATIELPASGSVVLEAAGLHITGVRDQRGKRKFRVTDGKLRVSSVRPPLEITYGFDVHDQSDGLLAGGSTVLWPYFCGNLFPCHSAPSDGVQLALELTGVPGNTRAIYPRTIEADAPSYMLAWAVGDYESADLGTTTAGTHVAVHWLPQGKTAALAGTKHLKDAFDWFEQHLGPYAFGPEVASVAVVWGAGAYGGMEHHPFWHVATDAMADEETHAHEAAHGWFGDAVRLRCWEDFVLSEGTVTYLAARSLGAVAGATKEQQIWASYQERLSALPRNSKAAWPTGCGKVDILRDGLFSEVPYMRGAFFYKAVAEAIGVAELDGVLARFYLEHQGRAAGMQDMLFAIQHDTGFDPHALVDKWLR